MDTTTNETRAGGGSGTGTTTRRRHLPDELEQLRRELAERDVRIGALQVRLIEATGHESRVHAPLHGVTTSWHRELAATDHLNMILFGSAVPERFDPEETRVRVLKRTLLFTPEQRLAWLNHLAFVPTPQVNRLDLRMDTIRTSPRSENNNLLVVGMSGSGKTWATTIYALRANGAVPAGSPAIPVLLLEAHEGRGSLVRMFREGLVRMGEPTSGGGDAITARFYRKVAEHRVELLIIDEAGNLDSEQRRRAVRSLTNTLKIPIIAVSAEEDWIGEGHLERRFHALHRFGPHKGSDLIELLAAFESYLPFPGQSRLFTPDEVVAGRHIPGPATFIEQRTGGVIDLVHVLVRHAAQFAIANGHDAITYADLEAGWDDYMVAGAKDGKDNSR